ncbi:aspartate/glutamate racemase family protein [Neobacillus sp. YX16]|uniref:maleate cis-trans isomerase family protein n=1 Tax=Neobacillus sp. YX16 TaxID=3047874 RepID=UPI0024C3E2C2|nr:aspartate/glutamate racemase family protein [Neobacillus sp. YX16]WHZ00879.1 aspartate/glutamate racemase family protein [Neobacillus sp. YX16]
MYGYKGKIGLLVPSLNTTLEPDFNRLAPEGVTVHSARVPTEVHGTFETLEKMGKNALAEAEQLKDLKPDVCVFGCTSASFLNGAVWTMAFESKLEALLSVPSVTTAGAMVEALHACKLKNVGVVTPYVEANNERLKKYLNEEGFEVDSFHGFEVLDMYSHADIPEADIYRAGLQVGSKSSVDGVFIACTQLKAVPIIKELEQELQIPVLTAVQVSMWSALKRLNIESNIVNYGSLFTRK